MHLCLPAHYLSLYLSHCQLFNFFPTHKKGGNLLCMKNFSLKIPISADTWIERRKKNKISLNLWDKNHQACPSFKKYPKKKEKEGMWSMSLLNNWFFASVRANLCLNKKKKDKSTKFNTHTKERTQKRRKKFTKEKKRDEREREKEKSSTIRHIKWKSKFTSDKQRRMPKRLSADVKMFGKRKRNLIRSVFT